MMVFSGVREVIYVFTGVWVTWVYTFVKTQTVLLHSSHFTACKLYFNKNEISHNEIPPVSIRMAKIQNLNNASVGKDVAKWYLLYTAGETVN